MENIEECGDLRLHFGKIAAAARNCPELIPVAVQNIDTGEVILVAYTNETAFKAAIAERRAILWSASRNKLWRKGETSGNMFELIEVYVNCEQNSLLYRVRPLGKSICHTVNRRGMPRNCFYRRLNMETMRLENLDP